MTFETLKYEVTDHIAVITLYRPERMNAYNGVMMDELIRLMDEVDNDDNVRAVIFTGYGRAFCAGADIGGGTKGFVGDAPVPTLEDGSIDYAHPRNRDGGGQITLRLFKSIKPIIGAINGAAVGIGATMTLPMDIRLASEHTKFGFVFARRGIVPEAASSWFLPRIVGISTALEWSYHGDLIRADEAQARGLVRSVHKAEDLLPAAHELAQKLTAQSAPVSIALTRQMMWRGLGWDHPMDAHKIDSRAIASRAQSEDAREGVESFFEKRPAKFKQTPSQDMPDFYPWWTPRDYR